MIGDRLVWVSGGRTFISYEHSADPEGMTHTVDIFEEDSGPRTIGVAISLMDAHAPSRVVLRNNRRSE